MKTWFAKPVEVPSGEVKTIKAVQLWEVRWTSRHGALSFDVRQEVEAFPTEAEAREFARALKAAFKLIKHSHGDEVSITKAR